MKKLKKGNYVVVRDKQKYEIPKMEKPKPKGKYDVLGQLQVGESVLVYSDIQPYSKVQCSVGGYFRKFAKKRFTSRKVTEHSVRVWRVK